MKSFFTLLSFSKQTFLPLLLILVLLGVDAFKANAQTNITLESTTTYPVDMSDIWGYEINGNEYGIVTTAEATSIVDVTNPGNAVELLNVSGPNTFWRDPKVHGSYAYITNEAGGGLQIIDLSALPGGSLNNGDVYYWTGGNYQGNNINFDTAHNFFIDENGIGYVLGANYGSGGAIMLDLNANPLNPPIIGFYDATYSHDAFVRGDTLWTCDIYQGFFSVVDISNKTNPVTLATQNTTSGEAHNIWVSDDGNYAFTTDETGNANIDAYDVSDLSDIKLIDTFQSSPGDNVVPHNVFVYGNYAWISYYRDGIVVLDISHPEKMVEVGSFDTSPSFDGNGFNGCWGVYPYLPSGNILATDIETGFHVFSVEYERAAFLEGLVTDASTSNPIFNASIALSGDPAANTNSDNTGNYLTGTAAAGTYTATISAPGFYSETVTVSLVNGQVIVQNVQLTPIPVLAVSGQVTDATTTNGIANAEVIITNGNILVSVTTNSAGYYSSNLIDGAGNYSIYVGKWGYVTDAATNQALSSSNNVVNIALSQGYYDDFLFDFGWTSNSPDASSGFWVRDVPYGTSNNGELSNPDVDISGDYGNLCYVTGNFNNNNAGVDDVDDGAVVLTSPVFDLSNASNPQVSYYRWFFNGSGNTTPDDNMTIEISNGINSAVVETIVDGDVESQWVQNTFVVSNYVTPTANMQLIVTVSDYGDGHLAEGGIDLFEVSGGAIVTPPITVGGQVLDADTNVGIANSQVLIDDNAGNTIVVTTDGTGNFTTTIANAGNYNVYGGQWGYITDETANYFFDANNNNITIRLEEGYYDDFTFDFGWTENGNSSSGVWERDEPFGTQTGGLYANPEEDVTTDFNDLCYVTGNANSNNAGTDDVDGGNTILTSPVFDLTGYGQAEIKYYRWFRNTGGNSTPDDEYTIKLSNGITTVTVETILPGDANEAAWFQNTVNVSSFITPTANMQLIAEASDLGDGHLVEAGLDQFVVSDGNPFFTPVVLVQAKLFLQGAYAGGSMSNDLDNGNIIATQQPFNMAPWNYTGPETYTSGSISNVVDWVMLEARDASNSNTVVDRRAALVLGDGTIVDTDGISAVRFSNLVDNTNYYLIARHRNHLDVISTTTVTLPNTNPYDFTNVNNVLGGATQVANLGGGAYGLFAGDIDSDGIISVDDFNYYISQVAGINVYNDADINLDGNITVTDFNIYKPNASKIGVNLVRY